MQRPAVMLHLRARRSRMALRLLRWQTTVPQRLLVPRPHVPYLRRARRELQRPRVQQHGRISALDPHHLRLRAPRVSPTHGPALLSPRLLCPHHLLPRVQVSARPRLRQCRRSLSPGAWLHHRPRRLRTRDPNCSQDRVQPLSPHPRHLHQHPRPRPSLQRPKLA